jgi:predicted transglutaminase-like cysteine proteinase
MRRPLLERGNARAVFRTISGFCLAFGLALVGTSASTDSAHGQTVASLPASSQPIAVRNMAARPIKGWVSFCGQNPAECAVDASEPETVELTAQVWQTIIRINRHVNGSIKPATDKAHWGVEDRWDFAEDGYGDCEDYQLVKRRLLVEAGFPRRALLMTVVIDDEGQGHAVMMVRTNRGDYILDNKRNAVLPWHQTGYTFVKREGDLGAAWASLGGASASPVATAGR